MHPRSEEVLNYLDQTRTELRAAVDSIPSPARDIKPGAEKWSVAEILDHLAITHSRVAALVSKSIAEAQANGLGPDNATSTVLGTTSPTTSAYRRIRRLSRPKTAQTASTGRSSSGRRTGSG